jgi:hypothetical protein
MACRPSLAAIRETVVGAHSRERAIWRWAEPATSPEAIAGRSVLFLRK